MGHVAAERGNDLRIVSQQRTRRDANLGIFSRPHADEAGPHQFPRRSCSIAVHNGPPHHLNEAPIAQPIPSTARIQRQTRPAEDVSQIPLFVLSIDGHGVHTARRVDRQSLLQCHVRRSPK